MGDSSSNATNDRLVTLILTSFTTYINPDWLTWKLLYKLDINFLIWKCRFDHYFKHIIYWMLLIKSGELQFTVATRSRDSIKRVWMCMLYDQLIINGGFLGTGICLVKHTRNKLIRINVPNKICFCDHLFKNYWTHNKHTIHILNYFWPDPDF